MVGLGRAAGTSLYLWGVSIEFEKTGRLPFYFSVWTIIKKTKIKGGGDSSVHLDSSFQPIEYGTALE